MAMAHGLSRWRDIRMLNLTANFDETGESTDEAQRFNGMAGALGPAQNWIAIEDEWQRLVSEFGWKCGEFHTTEIKRHRRETSREPFLKLLDKAEVLPLGWITSMDMIRAIDPVERTRRELVEPYMQAFRFCLFWSASIAPVIDSSLEEEVAVFIDCKVRFYDRVQAYYDYWRSTDSMARRIPATPQMRPSVSYIPLQAADLIAGVLRDEADRRLYRPNDAPQASFGALLSMASKRLHRTLDEYAHLPFCMLLTEADLDGEAGVKVGMERKEIEMKNDGKDGERFQEMLRTVVRVPKEEVKKYDQKQKRAKKKS